MDEQMDNQNEKAAQEMKKEALLNMRRSYQYKNRGLEIKINTMELLHKQVELLAEKLQRCEPDEWSSEQYRILELMARLGQAIIPD